MAIMINNRKKDLFPHGVGKKRRILNFKHFKGSGYKSIISLHSFLLYLTVVIPWQITSSLSVFSMKFFLAIGRVCLVLINVVSSIMDLISA